MLPYRIIEQRLRQALKTVLPEADTAAVLIRPCPDPKFGDYQTNALISLAKARKMNPRDLAAAVAGKLDLAGWCQPVETAGAGFLNFRLENRRLGPDAPKRRARPAPVLRENRPTPDRGGQLQLPERR